MPALLVLDDLGILCPTSPDSPEVPRDAAETSMVSWLCDLLDSLRPAGQLPFPGRHLLGLLEPAHFHFGRVLVSQMPCSLS